VLKPHGYAVISDPAASGAEWDTITCCHCQRVIRVKPGSGQTVYVLWQPSEHRWVEEMGAWCGCCNKPVCLACHDDGRCRPWERQMEAMEAKTRPQGWR
jgi:hypothetical protein